MAGTDEVTIQFKRRVRGLALTVALLTFFGYLPHAISGDLVGLSVGEVNSSASILAAASAPPSPTVRDNSTEEPFDPFAKTGELQLE